MISHCLITYKEFSFSPNIYTGKYIGFYLNVTDVIQNDSLIILSLLHNHFEPSSSKIPQYNDCIL